MEKQEKSHMPRQTKLPLLNAVGLHQVSLGKMRQSSALGLVGVFFWGGLVLVCCFFFLTVIPIVKPKARFLIFKVFTRLVF